MARRAAAGGMKEESGGYQLAGTADEEDLRALLRQAPMAGSVRLAFTREPEYFAGDGLAGAEDFTLVHRDESGALSGVARLSLQILHRNGEPRRIAYLGELRLAAAARHRASLLRGGYAELLRLLQAADPSAAPCCAFTSIAAGNQHARRVLENGPRFGLPAYLHLADLVTLLFPLPRRGSRAGRPAKGPHESAGEDELSEFLSRQAKTAHLTLSWDAARWRALRRHGIVAADFEVLREGGKIVAAAAIWDQRPFRQVVICGYAGLLRWARPTLHLLSKLGLAPPLPAAPATLAQGMVFGGAVAEPRHWSPLLAALRRAGVARGLDWLVITREARDPELAALRRLGRAREYATRLYEVCWRDWPPERRPWGEALFRPEAALL